MTRQPSTWHIFRTAAWLGWQIESNWTDPFLFALFAILKPIASVLILVFMYHAVATVGTGAPIYVYIYIGNAFYIYVGAIMAGASFAVLDDRERYRTLKYLYVAPLTIPVYLAGRAVARFITGSGAVLITLLAGILFFNVPFNPARIDWLLFAVTLLLGIVSLCLLGILIGVWSLTIRSEPWFLGDGLAAALYLFSGAIFPLTLLPSFLQPIGYALPMTYWLELIRRALLGPEARVFAPAFAAWSDLTLLGTLAGLTALLFVLTALAYRHFDWVAREEGMIDSQNNF